MGWILGFIGAGLSPALREGLVALHPEARWTEARTGRYLAAGGLPETCVTGALPEGGAFAVVGLGVLRTNNTFTMPGAEAWRQRLGPTTPDISDLDGHFVVIRHRGDGRLEVFTDALGVRTCYLTEVAGGVALSTRLDWLATLRGGVQVDLATFGTHWQAFNQLSTASLVAGIDRLGPGGHAVCTHDGYTTTEQPWTPEIEPSDRDGSAFARTLAAFVRPRTEDRPLSVGLSGGLDSRLLLALCLDSRDDALVRAHVFGPPDHPDAQIAHRIADREGLALRHLEAPVPDADACRALLREHVAQTQAVSAASAVLGLRYYPTLHAHGLAMIDGGLGEAARRQFMNRLLRRGRTALRSGDPAALLPYLRVPRADVFTPEARAVMERGALQQLATLWQTLPAPDTVGDENVIDLLGVRTRLPNFFGFEQNRLDGLIRNHMPFAQPSVLRAVFRLPVALRRNGRLFRRLIQERAPSLAGHPLVKGTVSYPFRLPTLPAFLWTKTKAYLGLAYTDRRRLRFLDTLRPAVLDLLHSDAVRTYAPYDHPRLTRLVEGFYDGATDQAPAVDWWLAFETWRQVMQGRS